VKQPIRLRGISGEVKGRTWEAEAILRAGRLNSLEIVLDDNSVSRKHAELRLAEQGWCVRDLESTNGTFVNGVRLGPGERAVRSRDIVQFGKVALIVEIPEPPAPARTPPTQSGYALAALRDEEGGLEQILVGATTNSSWEDAFRGVVFDRNRCPRPGEQLLALLRAGHHLVHIESEQELLHSVLNDAVAVLDAQRGAIVLATDPSQELQLRALATGRHDAPGRFSFSKKLAQRCFSRGESILCTSVEEDAELKMAESIHDGAMASVLCVLLRTPRKRLGVLHLDRGYWQRDFTEDDLHLADALAANVSAGIECAQLLRQSRDLFLNSITVLAQAVELRDKYTGGHTARVTEYSMLLARQLELPARDIELIRIGTPLHDIGKIGIGDDILQKPGRLTPEEFEVMKTHTIKGAAIISTIPDLHAVLPIVRNHHERWDGSGYPDRLAGDQIPLLARIVAVADAFDAMTSNRPYHVDKRGRPPEEAFEEVRRQAGRQFDPQCAAAFLAIQAKIVQAKKAHDQTSQLIEQLRESG
jgi:putative nucleotidyltransferase with HDIG domain